jgi:hypothetical protein
MRMLLHTAPRRYQIADELERKKAARAATSKAKWT